MAQESKGAAAGSFFFYLPPQSLPMAGPRGVPGSYIHFDLVSKDPKATRRFYEAAFGWSFKAIPFAGYALATATAPPHGGMRAAEAGEAPGMVGYLAVDSLEDAVARIEAAGGKVLGKEQKVPRFGRFVLFEAPGGVVQGVFEER